MIIKSIKIEPHPFETHVDKNAHSLIIGTFPTSTKNLQFPFYYSGKDNNFWRIIECVFSVRFEKAIGTEAAEERAKFLSKFGIGITDMHQKCYRINNSSKDSCLFIIKLNDIFSILDHNPSITKLILTSRTDIFGAWGLLRTYFMQVGFNHNKLTRRPDKILEGSIEWRNRKIKILVPYSPSPLLIQDNLTTFDELVSMYKKCFFSL